MCTAISYTTKDFYFGRNFDLEYSYREEVTIVPRNFPLRFRHAESMVNHHAMIGMAYVQENYPLFYDAVNEKGLCMAGLNFPGNAVYAPEAADRLNIAPFELIPFVLGRCATLADARALIEKINLAAIPFSKELPLTPLHWMISDRSGSLVMESTAEGVRLYENPVGVLTNSPPFPVQSAMLSNYMGLSIDPPENKFARDIPLSAYSRGMGAMGLPGDMSSFSRFVKAAFVRNNSLSSGDERESVEQFFHILASVEQPRGCVKLGDRYEITIYSCCCNADRGIYYYRTYEDCRIRGVDLHREDLGGETLMRYPLEISSQFEIVN